jgi:hypothetical protein
MQPKKIDVHPGGKDLILKIRCPNPDCAKKNNVDFEKIVGHKVVCGACKTEIQIQPIGMF